MSEAKTTRIAATKRAAGKGDGVLTAAIPDRTARIIGPGPNFETNS
jgi:hypothetical protein